MDPNAGWTGGFITSFFPYILITGIFIAVPIIIGIAIWKRFVKNKKK